LSCSNTKSVQGLAPTVSEDCGLKLSLSDKFNFVGPINQENIDEKFEGFVIKLNILFFM